MTESYEPKPGKIPDNQCKWDILPWDVKLDIFDFIHDKNDLLQISLTCKTMHSLATPKLYQNLRLVLGGPEDRPYRALLEPNHSGLPYIRHVVAEYGSHYTEFSCSAGIDFLDLDPWCWETDRVMRRPDLERIALYLKQLLMVLPRDNLKSCYLTEMTVPGELWRELYLRQRFLKNIECCRPVSVLENHQRFSTDKDLITSASVWGHADNEDITRASQLILSGCNNLTELKIASQNHEAPDSGAMGFEQRIFATLRDNKINASLEQQMQLKHLTLSGLNLAIFGAGHHRTTIDFSSLETLHILSCKKVHIFLDAVCRSKDPPRRLKKLTWHMTDLDEWRLRLNATMTRFEYLLRRQRELSDLAVIVNDRTRFPSVRDIVSRAKTLRVLSMMSTAHEATRVRFWMPRAVKEICDRCKGLVQLGLELHVEGLGRPWRSCVQSIVFRRALDSILQLEHLKALDLGNFWAVRYEQNARIGYTPEYDFFCFKRELREIAEVLFNARHLEKPEKRFNLEVVGASYYTDAERTLDGQPEAEPDEFIPPRILLTRVETGVAGKECRRAVPVNRCWTKKNLKDCDIFSSDDLYWSHAPTNGFPQ